MSKTKSCGNCGVQHTCILIRSIHDIIGRHFQADNQPFLPEEIAKICKAYLSESAVTTAKALHDEMQKTPEEQTRTDHFNTGAITT